MMKQEPGQQEIEIVLAKLNSDRKEIGAYVSHATTEEGDYIVTLTNGKIHLYFGEVKDADKLMPYRLPDIYARYRPGKK